MSKQKNRERVRESYNRNKNLDSIKILLEKNSPKGISELIHHLERYPDDANAYYIYGKFHEKNRNLKEAEFAYQIVADSPYRIRFAGMVGLGSIAEKKHDFAKAKALYNKVIAENPNEKITTFYALARLEAISNNYDKAIDILNQLTPQTVTTQIEKLKIYNLKGDPEKVFSLAKNIKAENPFQMRVVFLEQAKAAASTKDFITAKFYFLQAKDTPLKDRFYYKTLMAETEMLIESNDLQIVLDNCEELLQINNVNCAHVYYMRGQAYRMLGDYKAAIENYNNAEMVSETELDILQRVQLSLGRLQLAMGDLSAAEKYLKANVQTTLKAGENPFNLTIALIIGLYIRQERYEDAKKVISKMKEEYSETACVKDLNVATTLIAKLENKPIKDSPSLPYSEKQIINYKKSEAIAHIKHNHMGGNPDASNFFDSIDIAKLMEEIRPYLIEDNMVPSTIFNEYNIDYPNIGYSIDGTILNRLEIVVIPGTTNILTMYPDKLGTSIRQIDIKKQLSTTSSAISKFNTRFAKFVPPQSKK